MKSNKNIAKRHDGSADNDNNNISRQCMTTTDLLIDNKTIYNFELAVIKLFSYTSKIVLFLFLVGILNEKPIQIIKINQVLKIVISIFLIYRFNSYRKHAAVFSELDRKVAYSAGWYILTISFIDIISGFTESIRAEIMKYTMPIITYVKG